MNDLRKLAEAATPGPWEAQFMWVQAVDLTPIAEIEDSLADTAYIAAMSPDRTIVLLDHIEALQAALVRLQDAIQATDWDHGATGGEIAGALVETHAALKR